MDWLRAVRTGLTGSLFVLLAACGGGGGGGGGGGNEEPAVQGPPASPAALEQSGPEAIAAVRAAVDGGVQITGQANGAANLFMPTGDPFGRSGGADVLARARTTSREQALEVQTVACADFLGAPCAGSVTVDIDFDPNANVVAAGSRLRLSFNGLQGNFEGVPIVLDGTLRIDFLTAFDGVQLANTRIGAVSSGLLGTVDGISFGPETSALLIEFDAQERASLTVDGMRFSELDGIVVDDADDYRIGSARLRRAHWDTATAYVDCRYANWVSAAARTGSGSVATFTAGADSIVVSVSESSAAQITYNVDITVGGVAQRFVVTATYSAGVPTYTFVEA